MPPSTTVEKRDERLLRDGVTGIVEHLFDLRQCDLLRVVVDMYRLGRNINSDLADALKFADGPLDGVLAMLARNVRCYQRCRFHSVSPPFLMVFRQSHRAGSAPGSPRLRGRP